MLAHPKFILSFKLRVRQKKKESGGRVKFSKETLGHMGIEEFCETNKAFLFG